MSLDITFKSCKNIICPNCGKTVGIETYECEVSGGRGWYPILESLGYYVPPEERTEENDWYGKDMVLDKEQRTQVFEFIRKHLELYNSLHIYNLICGSIAEGNEIAINADW
jgi:hypothetical protein